MDNTRSWSMSLLLFLGSIIGLILTPQLSLASGCNYDTIKSTLEAEIQTQLQATQFTDWTYSIRPDSFTPCNSTGKPKVEFIVTLPIDSSLGVNYQQIFSGYTVDSAVAMNFVESLEDIHLVDAQLLVDKAESNSAVTAYLDYFKNVTAIVDITWTNGIYKNVYKNVYQENPAPEDAFDGKITYEQVTTLRKDKYPLIFKIIARQDVGTAQHWVSFPDELQKTDAFGPNPLEESLKMVFETTQKEESLLSVWQSSLRWVALLIAFGIYAIGSSILIIAVMLIKNGYKKNY